MNKYLFRKYFCQKHTFSQRISLDRISFLRHSLLNISEHLCNLFGFSYSRPKIYGESELNFQFKCLSFWRTVRDEIFFRMLYSYYMVWLFCKKIYFLRGKFNVILCMLKTQFFQVTFLNPEIKNKILNTKSSASWDFFFPYFILHSFTFMLKY